MTECTAKAYHSVVLKDLSNPYSDFRTELDFVLVTPSFILTTECKSYSGNLVITGDGVFTHRGKSTDVYQQNVLHHKYLLKYAVQLIIPGPGSPTVPVFANAFVFSNADIVDKRPAMSAKKMRIHTTSTLIDFYEQMFERYTHPVFNYQKACKVFHAGSQSKALHAEHARFLGYGG